MKRLSSAVAFCLFSIAACTTTPDAPVTSGTSSDVPAALPDNETYAGTTPAPQPALPRPEIVIPPKPASFTALAGWDAADLTPGLEAMRRSCAAMFERDSAAFVSSKARWAGRIEDWIPSCAALDVVRDERSARAVLQALFTPVEIVSPTGETRFTGYFEPTYEASPEPRAGMTEPVPAVPDDIVVRSGTVYQRQSNGRLQRYPDRAQITRDGVRSIAYAHPADVFFLQIQGSGRLVLPNGETIRAAYGANNGHPFKSTANWLIRRGWISRGEASMQGIRAWMDRAPAAQVREAMNANPRFIFFQQLPEGDPGLGPQGAAGIPLTPLGSMAVDLDLHPLGVPMFVNTTAPGLGGDWAGLLVSQDTGNAINGAVRGDIYFGTGVEAGERAGTMNAPGKLWVLLPTPVAERLEGGRTMAGLGLTPTAP